MKHEFKMTPGHVDIFGTVEPPWQCTLCGKHFHRRTEAETCKGKSNLKQAIQNALDVKDFSYAHVLLHSAAGIYNHTPYDVRQKRLAKLVKRFPTLCERCLIGCSQAGK